jgi:hypothetical protein
MILLLQLILCLIVGILDGVFVAANRTTHSYIQFGTLSVGLDGFIIFCSYFVLINTMIPISLIVSI